MCRKWGKIDGGDYWFIGLRERWEKEGVWFSNASEEEAEVSTNLTVDGDDM